jgi:hypothetical protein
MSSAESAIKSVQPNPARPAPAAIDRTKPRRLTTPLADVSTLTIVFCSLIAIVLFSLNFLRFSRLICCYQPYD